MLWSLGTRDFTEAKTLMPAALAKADAILLAARQGAKPLTSRQLHALAGLWYGRQLQTWERNPEIKAGWDGWLDTADAGDRLSLPPFYVDELLTVEGVVTGPESHERLAALLGSRLYQALRRQEAVDQGDYSPDPRPLTFPTWERSGEAAAAKAVPQPSGISVTVLASRWADVATVKPRSAAEAAYAISALVRFLGHDDAGRLTRDDLRRWRDDMKEAGLTNTTWNNRLSFIHQPLAFGVSEGLLQTDVTAGLRLPKNQPGTRLPFNDDDAVRILQAARLSKRASIRWAPWIMAFTGMRVAEVLQLTAGDVRQDAGIYFLSVNEDHSSKSVKTRQARNVPLHPALVAEGFLAFAGAVQDDAPLFPDKQVDRHGHRGGRAWNVVGLWVRKTVKITDPRKAPDHSWRHRVEDELRTAAVGEDVRDAIMGHARKTTGRHYGIRGEALKRLDEAVRLIPVPAGLEPQTPGVQGSNCP